MQRPALHFRRYIPQGNVEPGDREHRDAIAAEQVQVALDLLHERRDSRRIRDIEAARLRRNHLLDGGAGAPWADVTESVAPAGDPGIRRDLDDHHVERGDRGSTLPEARNASVIRNAQMVRPDVRDLHFVSFFEHGHHCKRKRSNSEPGQKSGFVALLLAMTVNAFTALTSPS